MDNALIRFPESYVYYMQPEHCNAFDQIEGKKKLPSKFTWEDIQVFNHAQFSLEVIKYEYHKFACELWEKTWGYAIGKNTSFIPCTADVYGIGEVTLSPDGAWNDRLIRIYSREDTENWFGVNFYRTESCIKLSWFVENARECLNADIELDSAIWEVEQDDDAWRNTRKSFFPVKKYEGAIDCTKLRNVASTIIGLYDKKLW